MDCDQKMKMELKHRFRFGQQVLPMKPQKLYNLICNNKGFLPSDDQQIDGDTLNLIIKEVVGWWFKTGLKQIALGSDQCSKIDGYFQGTDAVSDGMYTLKHLNRNVIKTRTYQREIFEMAKRQNVIAFMPTGSGKTRIAIKLIEYRLKGMYLDAINLENQQNDSPHTQSTRKHVIFLVCTTHLAEQQRGAIQRALPFIKIRKIIGADSPDFWKKKDWDIELKHYDVLVMMHDCLIGALSHGYITMKGIDLLIFDGVCHFHFILLILTLR